jgi:hypothetical protein
VVRRRRPVPVLFNCQRAEARRTAGWRRAAGARIVRLLGPGWFGVAKGTDQEVCPTYSIQDGKKRFGGLRSVFMGIQPVTGSSGENGQGVGEGVSRAKLMARIGVDLRDCIERAMTGEGRRSVPATDQGLDSAFSGSARSGRGVVRLHNLPTSDSPAQTWRRQLTDPITAIVNHHPTVVSTIAVCGRLVRALV